MLFTVNVRVMLLLISVIGMGVVAVVFYRIVLRVIVQLFHKRIMRGTVFLFCKNSVRDFLVKCLVMFTLKRASYRSLKP